MPPDLWGRGAPTRPQAGRGAVPLPARRAGRPPRGAEILEALDPKPGELVVDCTLGYGGHAQKLLERLAPGGRLIGLDADEIEIQKTQARLNAAGWQEPIFTALRTNFAGLPQVLAEAGVSGVDGLVADLGVSSMQLDNPERGFTFKADGPLDLRLNSTRPPSATRSLGPVRRSAATARAAKARNCAGRGAAISLCEARARSPIKHLSLRSGRAHRWERGPPGPPWSESGTRRAHPASTWVRP